MKKLNQSGFAHLALVGIAVLVLGVVGFAGLKVYQQRQVNAKAAGYSTIKDLNGKLTVTICRTSTGKIRFGIVNSTPGVLTYVGQSGQSNVMPTAGRHYLNPHASVTKDVSTIRGYATMHIRNANGSFAKAYGNNGADPAC